MFVFFSHRGSFHEKRNARSWGQGCAPPIWSLLYIVIVIARDSGLAVGIRLLQAELSIGPVCETKQSGCRSRISQSPRHRRRRGQFNAITQVHRTSKETPAELTTPWITLHRHRHAIISTTSLCGYTTDNTCNQLAELGSRPSSSLCSSVYNWHAGY